jgi:hypothetical protein
VRHELHHSGGSTGGGFVFRGGDGSEGEMKLSRQTKRLIKLIEAVYKISGACKLVFKGGRVR